VTDDTRPLAVVPSFGRAGNVSTVRVFPRGVIAVPARQEETYLALQDLPPGWSVWGIPEEEDGNIAKARNAILRHFPGRDVLMADDDLDHIGKWEGFYQTAPSRSKPRMALERRLSLDDVDWLLETGFRMAREVGTVLWGINVARDRRFYRPYTPFGLTSVVLGTFMGVCAERDPGLAFDEDLWLKEDFDFSLRVLHRYHRIWRMNAYYYDAEHLGESPGGLTGRRDMGEEVRQAHRLQRRWGSDVVKLQLHRSTNPIVKVPIRGV